MSDVVEKTLSALPSLLSLDSQPGASKLSPTSKLGHLVRNITELTSKNVSVCHQICCQSMPCDQSVVLTHHFYVKEEEKLITKELAAIKDQLSSPHTTMVTMLHIPDHFPSGSLML